MEGLELSCLNFWGLGALGKKIAMEKSHQGIYFYTDVPEKKFKRLILIFGKRKYANKVALGEFAACVRPAAPELQFWLGLLTQPNHPPVFYCSSKQNLEQG